MAKFTWEDFENKPLGNFQTSSGKNAYLGIEQVFEQFMSVCRASKRSLTVLQALIILLPEIRVRGSFCQRAPGMGNCQKILGLNFGGLSTSAFLLHPSILFIYLFIIIIIIILIWLVNVLRQYELNRKKLIKI